MLQLEVGKKLRSELVKLVSENDIKVSDVQIALERGWITFQSLNRLYEEYWKDDDSVIAHELFNGSKLKLPKKAIPGNNYTPRFRRQLEELRIQAQEMEYQEILKVKKCSNNETIIRQASLYTEPAPSIGQISREIREQTTTVINILVTIFGVVYSVWYLTGFSTYFPLHLRVLTCLTSGVVVLIADVVMYNIYHRKISEARKLEQNITLKEELLRSKIFSGNRNP